LKKIKRFFRAALCRFLKWFKKLSFERVVFIGAACVVLVGLFHYASLYLSHRVKTAENIDAFVFGRYFSARVYGSDCQEQLGKISALLDSFPLDEEAPTDTEGYVLDTMAGSLSEINAVFRYGDLYLTLGKNNFPTTGGSYYLPLNPFYDALHQDIYILPADNSFVAVYSLGRDEFLSAAEDDLISLAVVIPADRPEGGREAMALMKALPALSYEEAEALLASHDAQASFLYKNKEIKATEGLKKRIRIHTVEPRT